MLTYMPYKEPYKSPTGWVLPKKSGGLHKSSKGKVVKYKSKTKAKKAAIVINMSEHGIKMKKKKR